MDISSRTLPPRSAAAFLARVRAFFSPTAESLPSLLSVQDLTNSGLLTTSTLSLCSVGLRHPKVTMSTRVQTTMTPTCIPPALLHRLPTRRLSSPAHAGVGPTHPAGSPPGH